MPKHTTPRRGRGDKAPVSLSSKPLPRTRLKAAHRRTADGLRSLIDDEGRTRLTSANIKTTLRRHITRLANLAGVERDLYRDDPEADAYTRAMLAVYESQARGEDARKALRIARLISLNLDAAAPGAVTAPPVCPEGHAERTKRELLDSLALHAERPEQFRLTRAEVGSDHLAAYDIRKGDVIRATLDGDAEHGELAIATTYHTDRRRRDLLAGFLFVEGERLCLRRESHLECDGDHYAYDELTIIGRVVRVERAGLPVRLKGLELRGLPFADDPKPEGEGGRDA